jgi:hypothetical protein
MVRFAPALALVVSLAAASAQEPETKDAKPKPAPKTVKAPGGWLFHKAKDGSYSVLFPKDRAGLSHSDRSFSQGGFSGKQQVMQCTLKDGRELVVIGTALGGPATKDMKIGDVYDLMYDLDKEPGAKLSEPKEIQVGVRKGREHFVTKKDGVERNVVVVVRGRVYQLVVLAKDRKGTTDATADTFLTSLILHAPARPNPADPAKKPADAPKKDGP